MTTKNIPSTTSGEPTSGDPAEIRADIERTRTELGDTVEALAAKADVKARARIAAGDLKVRAKELAGTGRRALRQRTSGLPDRARRLGENVRHRPAAGAVPVVLAAGGAVVLAAGGAVVLLARRRARRRQRARWYRRG